VCSPLSSCIFELRKGSVKKMKRLVAILAMLFVPALAKADQIWTYEGNSINNFHMNPFLPPAANPCGCAIDATVTVNSFGEASTWSFTAAGLTLTNLNSTIQGNLGFAQVHPTNMWLFLVQGPNGETIRTSFDGSLNDALDSASSGPGVNPLEVGSNPGAWTEVVGTPEPASLSLLLVGLFVATFAWLSRRRQLSAI
jgi:hypothetical protein